MIQILEVCYELWLCSYEWYRGVIVARATVTEAASAAIAADGDEKIDRDLVDWAP